MSTRTRLKQKIALNQETIRIAQKYIKVEQLSNPNARLSSDYTKLQEETDEMINQLRLLK